MKQHKITIISILGFLAVLITISFTLIQIADGANDSKTAALETEVATLKVKQENIILSAKEFKEDIKSDIKIIKADMKTILLRTK